MNLYYISFRGLVRLKKVHKSEKNSDWPDYPQPTHYLFFWKHVQNTHQPTFEFLWEFFLTCQQVFRFMCYHLDQPHALTNVNP